MKNKRPEYTKRHNNRIVQIVINYIPRKTDPDVIAFLNTARANGENVTQLITDAIRLKMKEASK